MWGGGGRGKTYPLHPEPAALVHHLEEVLVLLAPEEVQAGDLEVGPEVAHVVLLTLHGVQVDLEQTVAARLAAQYLLGQGRLVVGVVLGQLLLLLGLGLGEHLPEPLRRDVVQALVGRGVAEDVGHRLLELLDGDGEAVRLVVVDHGQEGVAGMKLANWEGFRLKGPRGWDILGDVAEVLDLGLQAPVPLVLRKQRVLVEESATCQP